MSPSARHRRAAVLALALALAGCTRAGAPRTARTTAPAPTTSTAPTTTTTTDPGSLPQTDVLPPAWSPAFAARMDALWNGIVTGSTAAAMPAFFPESAYLQVKTVADPAADFDNRLVAEFGADIAAAHGLLPAPSAAALVQVVVPEQYAHWVPPGVCANRVGYYEVADARVVYHQGGDVRSFGIASLISWRGEWYVVHLGAIVRAGSGGVVDEPAEGPGASAPSHSC